MSTLQMWHSLIHTWLQPGVNSDYVLGNRFNGFARHSSPLLFHEQIEFFSIGAFENKGTSQSHLASARCQTGSVL